MKKTIAIVVNSLSNGGAERSNAMISKICEYLGHRVTIIAINDFVDFEYAGDYIGLGNQTTKNTIKRKWSKFRHAYSVFKNLNFDVVIDARSRPGFLKSFIYKKIIYKKVPTISMVHSSNMNNSFPQKRYFAKYLYRNDCIVTVSKKIKEIVKYDYSLRNVKVINNAVSLDNLESLSKENKVDIKANSYMLFYGRFEDKIKNLTFLLEAYANSILPQKGIKLLLLGKGPDDVMLKNKVHELLLSDYIIFEEFTPNPMPYVKKALFTVMTSNYEGFPMTIIESLSIGTPVVTLNFVSGPAEIIETGKNGILVKEKTTENFASALNKMVDDTEFYEGCKKHCKSSVAKFEMFEIAKDWDKLLQQL